MITIYGIDESDFRCGGCITAKKLLEEAGLDYQFKRIIFKGPDGDPAYNQELLQELRKLIKYTTLTLPYVFSGTTRIPLKDLRGYLLEQGYDID